MSATAFKHMIKRNPHCMGILSVDGKIIRNPTHMGLLSVDGEIRRNPFHGVIEDTVECAKKLASHEVIAGMGVLGSVGGLFLLYRAYKATQGESFIPTFKNPSLAQKAMKIHHEVGVSLKTAWRRARKA